MRIATFVGIALAVTPLSAQEPHPEPMPVAGPAERIWIDDLGRAQDIWFRRAFSIDKPLRSASLAVSCDDRFELFVNGKCVAQENGWQKLVLVNAVELLKPGDNAIAVRGTNDGSSAAMALWLVWETEDGTTRELVTDASWRVSETPVPGWSDPDFDDSAWKRAISQGSTPFGKNVYGMEPSDTIRLGLFEDQADAIDKALERMRSASDVDRALEALDRLEEALMQARRQLWTRKRGR